MSHAIPKRPYLGLGIVSVVAAIWTSIVYRRLLLNIIYCALVIPGVFLLFSMFCAYWQGVHLSRMAPQARDWLLPISSERLGVPLKYEGQLDALERARKTHERTIRYTIPFLGSPSVKRALDELIVLILKTFIRPWYEQISPNDQAFPRTVEKYLKELFYQLHTRIIEANKETDDEGGAFVGLIVNRIIPALKTHIVEFIKADRMVRASQARAYPNTQKLDLLIAERFRWLTQKLHPAVDGASAATKTSELTHIRQTVSTILPLLYPRSEIKLDAFRFLIREIAVCKLIYPIIQSIGNPDFCNCLIDSYATTKLTEITIIRRFREALRRQTQQIDGDLAGSRSNPGELQNIAREPQFDGRATREESEASPRPKTLEEFLERIKKCDELSEAKAIRNQIVMDIRKKRLIIADRPADAVVDGVKVRDIKVYINQLIVAKRKAENQIEKLEPGHTQVLMATRHLESEYRQPLSLSVLLTHNVAVTYFQQYLKQTGRSNALELWRSIEAFFGPRDNGRAYGSFSSKPRQKPICASFQSTATEFRRLYEAFVMEGAPHQVILPHGVARRLEQLSLSLRDSSTPKEMNREVVRDPSKKPFDALYAAQTAVYGSMKSRDLSGFRKSELYLRLLADASFHQPSRPPSSGNKRRRKHPPRILTRGRMISSDGGSSPTSSVLNTDVERRPMSALRLTPTKGRYFQLPKKPVWRSVLSDVDDPIVPLDEAELLPSDAVEKISEELLHIVSETSITTEAIASGAQLEAAGQKSLSMPRISFRKWSKSANTGMGQTKDKGFARARTPSPPTAAAPKRGRSDVGLDKDTMPESESPPRPATLTDSAESVLQSRASVSHTASPVASITEHPSDVDSHSRAHSMGEGSLEGDTSLNPSISFANSGLPTPSRIQDIRGELDRLKQQLTIIDEMLSGQGDFRGPDRNLSGHSTASKYFNHFISLLSNGKGHAQPGLLPILKKSRGLIQREMADLELQQKIHLEAGFASILRPDITKVSISGCELDSDGSREYTLYLISVCNDTGDDAGMYPEEVPTSWMISRRYRQFLVLQQKLKRKHPRILGAIEFPRKRPPASALIGFRRTEFLEDRRSALERYLRSLLMHEELCNEVELIRFLYDANFDTGQNVTGPEVDDEVDKRSSWMGLITQNIKRIGKREVSEDEVDDLPRAGFKDRGFRLNSKLSFNGTTSDVGDPSSRLRRHSSTSLKSIAGTAAAVVKEPVKPDSAGHTPLASPAPLLSPPGDPSSQTIADHITDIFIAIFELRSNNNWIRRQAVTLILQQILGGTLERKVTELLTQYLTEEESVMSYITQIRDMLWPNGEFAVNWEERTKEMKDVTRESAERKLTSLMTEVLGSIVGRNNARAGARHIMDLLQNDLLNRHLIYLVLDQITHFMFPEAKGSSREQTGLAAG